MRLTILCTASAFALAACAESDPVPPPRDEDAPSRIPGEHVKMPDFEPIGSSGSKGKESASSTDNDRSLGSDGVMQGEWSTKAMAGDPAALFGTPETEASFSVRCNAGDLVFSRSAQEPAGPMTMSVMAGGETRSINALSKPDPIPSVTGRLPAQDDFAAILLENEKPIAVRIAGGEPFRMPASDALREIVNDCRI